jgi:hypothetical protein
LQEAARRLEDGKHSGTGEVRTDRKVGNGELVENL